jgi:prepilin-type N-terminal cleavage/methylation domain-containing protein
MTFTRFQRPLRGRNRRAFTIVELLVSISILTLIVLVLYGLFDQVQKALLSNVAQIDLNEGGRAGMELLSREMEQMQAGNRAGITNIQIRLTAPPYQQALLGANENRTNILDGITFLTHSNKSWLATSYKVLVFTNKPANPFASDAQFADRVGTLCRRTLRISESDFANTNLLASIMKILDPALDPTPNYQTLTNYQRVVDGVVHFRIRAYDTNGYSMNYLTNSFTNVSMIYDPLNTSPAGTLVAETRYAFFNSALPAYLEVEMGILEPQVLERYRSYPNATVAGNYLARQSGAIHLFQQRVPIRMAK